MKPKLNSKTVFVIIEGHPKRPVLPVLYELEPRSQWQYLFEGTEWSPYQSESPFLVATGAGSTFLSHVMSEMQDSDGWRGLILESPEDFDEVLFWARQRLTVVFDPPRSGLLRYYDPLIWHELCSLNETASRMIEHGHYWVDEGDSGQWRSVDYPEPVSDPAGPSLSPAQLQALSALASRRNSGQSPS